MNWNHWLYILLIILGGMPPGFAVVASTRRKQPPPHARLTPTALNRSPWVNRCMRAFAPAVTGAILKASPTGASAYRWAIFRLRRTMRPATPGTMPTSGCSKSVKYGGKYHAPPRYRSAMPAYQEMLSDAEIWAVLAFIKSH